MTGQWALATSLRRSAPDGAFDGTLHIAVSTDYLARYWASVVGDPSYAVSLIRADGTLLAGFPERIEAVHRLRAEGAFRRAIKTAAAGVYTRLSAKDAVERITAYRQVGAYPVFVRVRVDTQEALAARRGRLAYYAALALGAIAVLLGLALAASRHRAVLGEAKQRAEAAEQRTRQAQMRLEQAIEALPQGFALFDAEDRLVLYNSRYLALYPRTREQAAAGASFADMLRAGLASGEYADAEDVEAWLDDRLLRHALPSAEFEQRLADGRWLLVQERRTPDGGSVGIRTDITELKTREESFRLLFESNPVPMWVYDRGTLRIVKANRSALAQYGYSAEEMLCLSMDDLRPAEEVARLRAVLGGPEAPDGRYGVWRHRRADGSILDVDIVSVRFIFDGQPAALVAAIDVTAQRKAEEVLRHAKDEAVAASRTKSQFLANMSHELRTPLNAVIGFSELIKDALMGPVDSRYRGYAHDIHHSGQHLLRLINDVLDLSKVEAGRLELSEAPLDLRPLVAACRAFVAGRAADRGVRLEEELAPDLPPIVADELRLKQVLINLLSNAVKFTPAGGTITVSAQLAGDGGLALTVADTGIGMRAEDIPAALEPFRQVDGELNRRFEGTGLGLPLARKLAELHGGTLELESAPGRGTVVRVRLPAARVLRQAAA